MRIKQLLVENFKGFSRREFTFQPGFNLIVGTNGAGKTSALDALAVAIGSWFLGLRGYDTRPVRSDEVRLSPRDFDGEIRFEEQYPTKVSATGEVLDQTLTWERSLNSPSGRTTHKNASNIMSLSTHADRIVRSGEEIILPLISYYGTGRLWQEPRAASQVKKPDKFLKQKSLSRLEGYKNSIDPRLSIRDLALWIARQSWSAYQQGKESPVFQAAKSAILACVEDAKNLYFDPKIGEIIVVMQQHDTQPFFNLSDGQRCMLAMAGDIAQKAATLNPQLGNQVLQETSGVVLIDELDLHLHPQWQRRVIQHLRRTFPNLQFICTTHSPQLIGEVKPEEIILLDVPPATLPGQSFGMDSNWILRHIMNSDDRDPEIASVLDGIFEDIDECRFEKAEQRISSLRFKIGDHPDLVEAEALISRYTRFSELS